MPKIDLIPVHNRTRRAFVLNDGKVLEPGTNNVSRELWEREVPMLEGQLRRGELVVPEDAKPKQEGPEVPGDLAKLRVPEAVKLIGTITDADALLAYTEDPREKVAIAATRRLEQLGKV